MRVNVSARDVSSTPPAPGIVFLHGVGSSSATWAAVMERLEDRYAVAAFDLMGHGDSPVPEDPGEYTRDRALDDLDDVIAHLRSGEAAGEAARGPVVIVGHSLGGYLALAHAATRLWGQDDRAARGVIALNTGPGFRDPEKRDAWNERSRRNAHRFGVPLQAAELNIQEDGVVMERLGEMSVPTLILAGDADRPEYSGAGQYLERKLANGAFTSIAGGEHAMHEDTHAAEVADLIHSFTERLD